MLNTDDADNFQIKEVETFESSAWTFSKNDADNFQIKDLETLMAVPSC